MNRGRDRLVEHFGPGSQGRTLALTVLALLLILAGLFAWRAYRLAPPEAGPPPPIPVAATVVSSRIAPVTIETVGTLRGSNEVMLAPEVAGRVEAILFRSGQFARKGALLVQLYDGPEQADRRAAVARAEFARIQVKRSEELAPTGAESRELLQQRRAELAQALAAVQQIDARIRQKQVRAPFAGQLGIRRVNAGQYVNPGDVIVPLTALSPLFVEFAVPQQELGNLKQNAQVIVTSDAYPGRTFTARVTAIDPVIGEETRNVMVQATLANQDHALRPGMYVAAGMVVDPQATALIVPPTAIQTSAQGNSVIIIRGNEARKGGKVEVVAVETGRRIDGGVVVKGGLRSNDVIVVDGQSRIPPGAMVKVVRVVGAEAH